MRAVGVGAHVCVSAAELWAWGSGVGVEEVSLSEQGAGLV